MRDRSRTGRGRLRRVPVPGQERLWTNSVRRTSRADIPRARLEARRTMSSNIFTAATVAVGRVDARPTRVAAAGYKCPAARVIDTAARRNGRVGFTARVEVEAAERHCGRRSRRSGVSVRRATEHARRNAVMAAERLRELRALTVGDLAADVANRQLGCLQQPGRVLHADRRQLVTKGAAGQLGEHALELALGRGDVARNVA